MRQVIIGLGLCALLAWGLLRDQPPPTAQLDQAEFFALGTLVQIKSGKPLDSALLADLQQLLTEFEQRWTVLGNGSLVDINRELNANDHAALPGFLKAGFESAVRACQQSRGLFDPALGNLVALWGFDDDTEFRSTPPEPAEISSVLENRNSLCDATLDQAVHFPRPGTRLNFGASAKGRAVDLLLAYLIEAGHDQAIVNAGGDLKVVGQAPGRPWRVGIRQPRPNDDDTVLASMNLYSGEAIFTSGDYERYFEFEGRRYHHLIDPRTGYPATQAQSATVIHTDAEWADAASTALFIAGPELAETIMQSMGISDWLLVDQQGLIHTSASMQQRIEATEQP